MSIKQPKKNFHIENGEYQQMGIQFNLKDQEEWKISSY